MAIKRDYQRKDLKNPFFKKPKKCSWKKWVIVLFVFLFSGIILYAGFSRNYALTDIQISGNQYTDAGIIRQAVEDQLAKRRFLFFSQRNIFLLSKAQLGNTLQQEFQFSNVRVEKKYFHSILIIVAEKKLAIVVDSGASRYYLDDSGLVVRTATSSDQVVSVTQNGIEVLRPQVDAGNYEVVYDQSNTQHQLGDSALSVETISFIQQLSSAISDRFDFDIVYFTIINSATNDIDAMTNEGWSIKFKSDSLLSDQLNSLSLVLQNQVHDRTKLKYIDVRFVGKIFYE